MSKPYQHPCNDCGGSGDNKCTDATDCDNINHENCCLTERINTPCGTFKGIKACKGKLPCPTCKGSGKMGLFVPCEKCENVNFIDGGWKCASCTDGKRPLTVAEVEEWWEKRVPFTSDYKYTKHEIIIRDNMTFMGSPVTIAPLEGKV